MSRSGSYRRIIPSTTLAYTATVPCTGAVPSRPPARQPAPPCLDAGSIRCVAAGDTARCGEWHVRWRALLRGRRRLGRGRGWSRAWVGRGQSQKNGAQLGLRSEQERVRAAVLSTASSRCGLLGLALDEILSLASRLRWLAPKSFLSVRFSCFSSKRPNSAAMTDVGAARVRCAARGFRFRLWRLAKKIWGCERRSQTQRESSQNAESNVFFTHDTDTDTDTALPSAPALAGRREP